MRAAWLIEQDRPDDAIANLRTALDQAPRDPQIMSADGRRLPPLGQPRARGRDAVAGGRGVEQRARGKPPLRALPHRGRTTIRVAEPSSSTRSGSARTTCRSSWSSGASISGRRTGRGSNRSRHASPARDRRDHDGGRFAARRAAPGAGPVGRGARGARGPDPAAGIGRGRTRDRPHASPGRRRRRGGELRRRHAGGEPAEPAPALPEGVDLRLDRTLRRGRGDLHRDARGEPAAGDRLAHALHAPGPRRPPSTRRAPRSSAASRRSRTRRTSSGRLRANTSAGQHRRGDRHLRGALRAELRFDHRRQQPRQPDLHLPHGRGKPRRAWNIARRLRGAERPEFQDTYGWIALRRGEVEEALAHLEPAAAARRAIRSCSSTSAWPMPRWTAGRTRSVSCGARSTSPDRRIPARSSRKHARKSPVWRRFRSPDGAIEGATCALKVTPRRHGTVRGSFFLESDAKKINSQEVAWQRNAGELSWFTGSSSR
jgi:cellulose synthase operon protein C